MATYAEIAEKPQASENRRSHCLQPRRRLWAIEYLKKHGPAKCEAIAAHSGTPASSMQVVLLRYKDTFVKVNRFWQLIDQPEVHRPVIIDGKRPWWSFVN